MPRIFVVEDQPHILRLIQSRLEDAGYQVDTAAGGAEALARMRENRPDLLVSDNQISEMGGRELVAQVRSDPDLANLPVIALISSRPPDHPDPVEYNTKADIFLSKPFSSNELIRMIRKLLGEEVEAPQVEAEEAEAPEPAEPPEESLWKRLLRWMR